MKKHNIKVKVARTNVVLEKEKVTNLYNSGMSVVRVGEALGVSIATITRFMTKHNIRTRSAIKRDKWDERPVKMQELTLRVDKIDGNHAPLEFKKRRTLISNEPNMYIPEKWNRG